MTGERSFYLIAIAILIGVIVLLRACSPTPTPEKPEIIRVTDTTWVKKDTIIYRDKPVPYRVEVPVEIPANVDTMAILKDYFSKYTYKDSIAIDSFGFVYLKDIITQNKIEKREFRLDYKLPIIKDSITVIMPPEKRTQVYIGGDIIVGAPTGLTYLGPRFTLKTKQDQLYSIGAGFSPTGGVQYQFGTSWKIKLRK